MSNTKIKPVTESKVSACHLGSDGFVSRPKQSQDVKCLTYTCYMRRDAKFCTKIVFCFAYVRFGKV